MYCACIVGALRKKNLRGMGGFAFAVPPCCPILAGCQTSTGGVREDIFFFQLTCFSTLKKNLAGCPNSTGGVGVDVVWHRCTATALGLLAAGNRLVAAHEHETHEP